jgi:hypothetical protein
MRSPILAPMQVSEAPRSRWEPGLFISLIVIAIASRLVSLQWLHPLQWDEVEFFRATDWVRLGLLPYRDFWEHHTPLQWFLFAPLSALAPGAGVGAIVAMRWLQIPLWIVTFVALMRWMRGAGVARNSRWAALAIALGSSLFMIPAVEYRVDTVACCLYVAAMLLLQRSNENRLAAVSAGALLALTGFANLRLGPLLALTVLLIRVIDPEAKRWKNNVRAHWVWLGVAAVLAAAVVTAFVTGALGIGWQSVWTDNYLGDRYGTHIRFAALHRLLVPFGIRVLASGSGFDPWGVDIGGIAILLIGTIGLIRGLGRWRNPDWIFLLSLLQVANLAFILKMKSVYVYHFEIVVILMIPLIAAEVARWNWRTIVGGVALGAVLVSSFAALSRGKERDRVYQDTIMREADARTAPGDRVFDGVGWAIRRKPAYRFWFLPDLARQLVAHGGVRGYGVREVVADPPAAVIADQNAIVWMSRDRELMTFFARHYVPVWRNLWLPGMNAIIPSGQTSYRWLVPGNGQYRPLASDKLVGHPWFREPLMFASRFEQGGEPLSLPVQADRAELTWTLDGVALKPGGPWLLRKGQALEVRSVSAIPLALLVVPASIDRLFQQPAPGVSLDAAGARRTHVPEFGAGASD